MAKTEVSNHCWLPGLTPETDYQYKVFVKDEEWAAGERWDWSAPDTALVQMGGRYENRFRTSPDPAAPADSRCFAVIGDFGVGVKKDSPTRRQQKVAHALRGAIDTYGVRLILTTGDNIYAGTRLLGIPIGGSGDQDDDWFFTYFQPYRYVINRVPVFPSIGNHDGSETEERDDRAQVEDNFYLRERLVGSEEGAGRASFSPGLFYRFRYGSGIEFVCLDTSKEDFFRGHRLFEYPEALGVHRSGISGRSNGLGVAHSFLPSSAIQRRSAALQHEKHAAPGSPLPALRRQGALCRPRAQLSALIRGWNRLLHHRRRGKVAARAA